MGITELPPAIGELRDLRTLRLGHNNLTRLPSEIGKLTRLTDLDLSFNQLVELPRQIRGLESLTAFNLYSNKLVVLPPEIGEVATLRTLNLSGNNLTALPSAIARLERLESLDVSDNRLTTLPVELDGLQNLAALHLDGNPLLSLPLEIGRLTKLEELRLHGCGLTAFPPQIGQLTGLAKLQLASNDLAMLAPEIIGLSSLRELYLHDNRFTTLPDEVLQLEGLTWLSIGKPVSRLPREIVRLKRLRTLDLHDNKLTTLPPEIGDLGRLTRLILSDNELTALPPEIGRLTHLTELSLRGNRLQDLPEELGQLPRLKRLSVVGNRLPIRPEIAARGNAEEIITACRERPGSRWTKKPATEGQPARAMVEEDSRDAEAYLRQRLAPTTAGSRVSASHLGLLREKAVARVTKVSERRWRAPTAWVAAVWLHELAAAARGRIPASAARGGTFPMPPSSPLLFRGQKKAAWGVIPSMRRPENPPRDTLALRETALRRFSLAMAAVTQATDLHDVRREAHVATAQHYGLRTDLLDFTVAPLVAIFFACADAPEGDEVAVYWLSFEEAVKLRARIIIPPPWVERLYRQRGLFLDVSGFDARGEIDIKDQLCQLVFPASASLLASDLIDTQSHLLPYDDWLQGAVEWARSSRMAVPDESEATSKRLAEELTDWNGEATFRGQALMPAKLLMSYELFFELLELLAVKESEGAPTVDCFPVQVLWRDNPGLISTLLQHAALAERLRPMELGPVNERLLRLLREMASCLGRGLVTVPGEAQVRSILSRVEEFVTAEPPPGGGTEPYDARLRERKPVPPTRVDTFVSDLWLQIQRLGLGDEGPGKVSEYYVGAALEIYLMRDWLDIPGYRPWTHWNFVRRLSTRERAQLAGEVANHMHTAGIKDH